METTASNCALPAAVSLPPPRFGSSSSSLPVAAKLPAPCCPAPSSSLPAAARLPPPSMCNGGRRVSIRPLTNESSETQPVTAAASSSCALPPPSMLPAPGAVDAGYSKERPSYRESHRRELHEKRQEIQKTQEARRQRWEQRGRGGAAEPVARASKVTLSNAGGRADARRSCTDSQLSTRRQSLDGLGIERTSVAAGQVSARRGSMCGAEPISSWVFDNTAQARDANAMRQKLRERERKRKEQETDLALDDRDMTGSSGGRSERAFTSSGRLSTRRMNTDGQLSTRRASMRPNRAPIAETRQEHPTDDAHSASETWDA
jgi:hypothetical protein